MLVQIESKYIPTAPVTVNLMVAPTTPVSVSSFRDTEGLYVGHESHNNGGYKNVQGSVSDIVQKLENAGAKMVKFRVLNGEVYLNINSAIPMSVSQHDCVCKIGYPTHNNGGYKIYSPLEDVVRKIESALSAVE